MATHSSVLAWRIPGMGEPGGLPSMGSHRVEHNWSDLAAAACVKYVGVLFEFPKQLGNKFPGGHEVTQVATCLIVHVKLTVFLLLFRWSNRCWQFISGSSAFSKSSLNIWEFAVHELLKPCLENFEHYFASVWDECNCAVVEHSLALPFFGIEMKTDLFQFCVTAEFSRFAGILSVALSQHYLLGFEIG